MLEKSSVVMMNNQNENDSINLVSPSASGILTLAGEKNNLFKFYYDLVVIMIDLSIRSADSK